MAHLLFAALCTACIPAAVRLEERNLVDEFGETYREYRRRVPMIDPLTGKRREKRVVNDAARVA